MSDSDLLVLVLLVGIAFVIWCLACACLLAVSRLAARAARGAGQSAHDAREWATTWVLYAITECGQIDDDPDLYAARAAAVDHHRITITRGTR